jgi:phospholipase C
MNQSPGMRALRHLVVVMLENRSFDNMLAFAYAPENNQPPINIPPPQNGLTPTYDGLYSGTGTEYWNPTNSDFFSNNAPPVREYVRRGTSGFTVPNPDPQEHFRHITSQIFGPLSLAPTGPTDKEMRGFYLDYATTSSKSPTDILQCYSSDQVPVITGLARNYAVCDRWFASCPTQTWPNRAFTHLGTSLGKVNNWPYDPFHYDTKTIFNVLDGLTAPWGEPVSWAVFNDSIFPSLTRVQLPKLWDNSLDGHFQHFEVFKERAAEGILPTYSFIEPSFILDPNDEHPPHDVRLGETFIYQVWRAVVTGKHWEQTLLLITYDEHGGCYDHVKPPFGAVPPDDASKHGDAGFGFDRFGVRVPAILISPYVEPGTVFRSETAVPYDHTSILAMLRNWLGISASRMLTSARLKAAPSFENVLTRSEPNRFTEEVKPREDNLAALRISMSEPLNDVQKSIVVAMEAKRAGRAFAINEVHDLLAKIPTRGHLMSFLKLKF